MLDGFRNVSENRIKPVVFQTNEEAEYSLLRTENLPAKCRCSGHSGRISSPPGKNVLHGFIFYLPNTDSRK